jgi:hypothetical protein
MKWIPLHEAYNLITAKEIFLLLMKPEIPYSEPDESN